MTPHPSSLAPLKLIPLVSVNEYQLLLGRRRQRQVWCIPIADERVGVQVKLWDPLRTHAIPERFWGGVSRRGAISSVRTFTWHIIWLYSGLSTGCADEGDWQGGILQSVEGIHSILRPSRTPHGSDLHLPRADECCILQVRAEGWVEEEHSVERPCDFLLTHTHS